MVKLNIRTRQLVPLVAAATCLVVMIGCAASSSTAPATAAKANQRSAATPAAPSVVSMRAELSPEPRVVVNTSGRPAHASYSPQPDVFVLDFPRATKTAELTIPSNLPPFVASVSADEAIELGTPLTRVTFRFTEPVAATASANADHVVVSFAPAATAEVTSETVIDVAAIDPAPVADEPVVSAAPITAAPELPTRAATRLTDVRVTGSGPSLRILLSADGRVEYTSFRLSNPLRAVFDLAGVRNLMTRRSIDVKDPVVKRVRVSQFKDVPVPVTRVVLDLSDLADYRVNHHEQGLAVLFGEQAEEEVVVATPRQRVEPPVSQPAATATEPVPAATLTETSIVHEVPAPAQVAVLPEPPPARQASLVINAAQQQTPPEPDPAVTVSPLGRNDDVFVEPSTAPVRTGDTIVLPRGGSRTISGGSRAYTGELIDLSLKDADIKDVLRTFAQITGLNVAIDPNVNGTVTVEFDDVPWDQALELILRQNNLTYVLDGNVMRVGTIKRLSDEATQTRQFEEQERLNVPLQTVIKHLSYADARDVSRLLERMASPRGKIVIDERTNQLILTDIPTFMQTLLNLVETVDIPTPQVVIEARIVETTKNFTQDLGISWGFTGALDPALGTGTGLSFPNRVGVVAGPFDELAAGNPVLNLSFDNVLGTFDLDVVLTAAESEGFVKIISAPKIQTEDNFRAEIRSGSELPLQTRVNFTTTVTYVDATLRLSVRPHITSEDTVIMDIEVQKVEPAFGILVAGSENSPLFTRRAKTRLMVSNGGTAVIGGIYQATENRAQQRVPFLHELPVIGNLFKNSRVSSRHDELLIFITPRIVRNS